MKTLLDARQVSDPPKWDHMPLLYSMRGSEAWLYGSPSDWVNDRDTTKPAYWEVVQAGAPIRVNEFAEARSLGRKIKTHADELEVIARVIENHEASGFTFHVRLDHFVYDS